MDNPPINEEEIFQVAAALAVQERTAYLNAACGGDLAVRARIERLLGSHEGGDFMRTSAPLGGTELENLMNLLKPEESGERIGHYKLRERIGEGGFGVVWVADQETPVKRRVALKIIKLGMDTKEVIARFEQERQALAMMDHPNIAKVLDAGATQQGRPYFVMELVRGIKITDYCDQANLPTADRLALFIQVCRAVQHAHQKGIIHRDLKPSNILVTLHDGVPVPKVIDFGVAKATQGRLAEHTIYTQFQQMVGTPLYMSPEQAEMSGLDIDTRSDIYSLGVLLYELLTGRTPVDAETLLRLGLDEIRRIIREQEPPRPSIAFNTIAKDARTHIAQHRQTEPPKLSALLRGDLDWIVMKALEKDRTRRYETANGLAMDIQRHLASEPVQARPPSPVYRLSRFVRRNRPLVTAGAVVALTILAGLAASIQQAIRAHREAVRANAMLHALCATAPAFAAQARGFAVQERFDEALTKLRYAAQLQPAAPEYQMGIGDLLECQLRFSEAAIAYRLAAGMDGAPPRARQHAELCEKLDARRKGSDGSLPRDALAELFEVMSREQRPPAELMAIARLLGREGALALEYWRERLRDLPATPDRPMAVRLKARPDGLLALDLSGTAIADLRVLAGMPLAELSLASCSAVRSLAGLEGLPLTSLDLDSTAVADVTILHGSALRHLSLKNTRVSDLAPLSGVPLQTLDATNLAATDYTALAAAPMEVLILNGARIRDASFVEGMPLRTLALAGASDVRNLAAIPRLARIDTLILPENLHDLALPDLAVIESLRDHPSLKRLAASSFASFHANAAGAQEAFWSEWQADLRWLTALRRCGVKPLIVRLPDRTWELDLRDQELPDLTCLAGARLAKLVLFNVGISDLHPLEGMPLRVLDLRLTQVEDLSPLHSMPLRELYLWRVKVRDFSVLASLPELELLDVSATEFGDLRMIASQRVRFLRIGNSRVTDLAPLAGWPLEKLHADSIDVTSVKPLLECPKLRWLIPPQSARDLGALKGMASLQRISRHWREDSEPTETAEEFWRQENY